MKLTTYKKDDPKQKKFDKMLLKFMVKDTMPFSVTDNTGFKNLVHTLDPKINIQSRRTIVRNLDLKFKEVNYTALLKFIEIV